MRLSAKTVSFSTLTTENESCDAADCGLQKVQSMSLISVLSQVGAYHADSSDFGGNDENENLSCRQALGDRKHP